jgi:hypothetical protein
MGAFLEDIEGRKLSIQGYQGPLRAKRLHLGEGRSALEIAVMTCTETPSAAELKKAWSRRADGRATPVLLVAISEDSASLCGPGEPEPPVRTDVDPQVAERICRAALNEPDHHAARAFLTRALQSLDTALVGIRNEGLFATHHLSRNVPLRDDWDAAATRSQAILHLREARLLEALGFDVQQAPSPCLTLSHQQAKVAIAVVLDPGTDLRATSAQFRNVSPIAHALATADRENLPYVMIVEGACLRLYATNPTVGPGRRGRTDTYLELQLDLLSGATAGYLNLLFSADALRSGGSAARLLEESSDYAASVGARLRERVYLEAVPTLAAGVAKAMGIKNDAAKLRFAYETTLTLLFRILFIAYAEDRRLLPYQSNEQYRRRSLKVKARELSRAQNTDAFAWDSEPTYWNELMALFSAIDKGKPAWGVAAYNGGLFSPDAEVSPHGAQLAAMELPDSVLGPVLRNLLVEESAEGLGPVDFRSLGVREFGTIYEGLLENDLAIASADLATESDGSFRPAARRGDNIAVAKGTVYLRNRQGARKATGSFFTKPFIVDHLLDASLEPALREHVGRLRALGDVHAAEAFFDFRIVDLAMGSGHFLVAAIDRVEAALSGLLAERNLIAVTAELTRLRTTATKLSPTPESASNIDDEDLLRRQIARRCIYGVDINPIAVELSRLSVWIHTFVPGLPLSFLDHNLIRGDSLTGVASLAEVSEELSGGTVGDTLPLYGQGVRDLLCRAESDIREFEGIADADRQEVHRARLTSAKLQKTLEPLKRVLDYATAVKVEASVAAPDLIPATMTAAELTKAFARPAIRARVDEVLAGVTPVHFPIAFPEVFLRTPSGFNVVVGNPPWEELMLGRDRFWTRHIPGLQGLNQRDREDAMNQLAGTRRDLQREYEHELASVNVSRKVLMSGGFPGMGSGDPDLYKAFVWRFWKLASPEGGRVGLVLPRSAFQTKGGEEFRRELFQRGQFDDLTFVLNAGGWVFEDVHQQYTIALTSLKRTLKPENAVPFRGPYRSLSRFLARSSQDICRFPKDEVLGWTDTAALPLLPSEASAQVFAQLRKAPRLDSNRDVQSWRARPHTEFHATSDKKQNGGVIELSDSKPSPNHWPVYKGASFDIWHADTGEYYGYADPTVAVPLLEARRLRGLKTARSPFAEFGRADNLPLLECKRCRIAFRNVTRATDSRTVRAALLPPMRFISNAAPYLLFPRGDSRDEAFVLGILSSRCLDWYARRFVEINLNYHLLNPLPIPRPARDSQGWKRVVELSGRLACPDARFSEFAEAVGVEPGVIPELEKTDLVHELEAVIAHLYGVTDSQLAHIFETFHEGWDYAPDLDATLRHFAAWASRKVAA